MIVVAANPPGGEFEEFLRVDIIASDDGNVPITSGIYEIVFTTDGTMPDVDPTGLPVGTSKKRRSPIKQFPISRPTTLKLFARTSDGANETAVQSLFFDIIELTAKREIRTAPPQVRNYTLMVENGDLRRNSRGGYDIVTGQRKVSQDIREALLVENVPPDEAPGDRTLPRFGSALNRLLGQSLPPAFTRSQLQTSIYEAITFLAELQRIDQVPLNEQIRRVRSVSVEARTDGVSFKFNLAVELVSGEVLTETGIVGG